MTAPPPFTDSGGDNDGGNDGEPEAARDTLLRGAAAAYTGSDASRHLSREPALVAVIPASGRHDSSSTPRPVAIRFTKAK